MTRPQGEIDKITERLRALETISQRLDRLSNSMTETSAADDRLQTIDRQLDEIRAQHDVQQRLIDPLRTELIKYREAFVREVLQKTLVQDLTRLDDELRIVLDCIKRAAEVKRGRVVNWARGFDCSIESLTDILQRLQVSEIPPHDEVDPSLHRVVSYEPTEVAGEDGTIVAHVKRGLMWHDQVLRREDVIAKRYL